MGMVIKVYEYKYSQMENRKKLYKTECLTHWGRGRIYASIRPVLVQIMACRLLGGKPSSEQMLAYWKCVWKCRLRNGGHFVSASMYLKSPPYVLSHAVSGQEGWYKVINSCWWRHQMETFSALQALCTGNSPVISGFPAQRPVTRRFDVFFDLRLNKQLSKQAWGCMVIWDANALFMMPLQCRNSS